MISDDDARYLRSAADSERKRAGASELSLLHLARACRLRFPIPFGEVFDADQSMRLDVAGAPALGGPGDVEQALTSADDLTVLLTSLRDRLAAAPAPTTEPGAEPEPAPAEVAPDGTTHAAWPERSARFVTPVPARDDLVGRSAEVAALAASLSTRRHRVPILLGPAGSGRTAVLGGLAATLGAQEPARPVVRVGADTLGWPAEDPLRWVLADAPAGTVLCVDDLDRIAMLGAERPDLAVLFQLVAARTDLSLVLTCDTRWFSRLDLLVEAYVADLVPVRLGELDPGQLLDVVRTSWATPVSEADLVAACQPRRSSETRAHPGLALDRLDLGAARSAAADPEPAASMKDAMAERLRERVKGQDAAVDVVARRLSLTLAQLDLRPARPDGVFLFVGPTGVGKTELARALADVVFGSEERLIRLDMSEYAHDWAVSRIVGPMPGYVGSTDPSSWLTTRVTATPECVVLLDEIEKAHPIVWNTFLQAFDAGRLTDSRGVVADLSQVVFVMTSNLGVVEAQRPGLGFVPAAEETAAARLLDVVKERLPPELVNRVDELAVFSTLSLGAIEEIAAKEVATVVGRLSTQGWQVTVDPAVVGLLATSGYDAAYGARHLQRNLERLLLAPLADSTSRRVDVSVVDGHLEVGDLT